jgi:predicted ATPase
MRLTQLTIQNFRGIASLSLQLNGDSLLLLGANGAGKSAVLAAIAKSLGADRGVAAEDFLDPSRPVEITVTLDRLGEDLAGTFNRQATFAPGGPFLTIGVHASLEGPEVEVVHGFPSSGWSRASRGQLRALPVIWLSADREHRQLLSIVGARSLLGALVAELDLEQDLDAAGQAVAQAAKDLAAADPLHRLLDDASAELSRVLADTDPRAFGLQSRAPIELLRQLELLLMHGGHSARLSLQSSGLAHLAILSVALVALARHPGTVVLLDEPELSLHPQAARAVVTRLRESEEQVLLATHSADALSRWDLRRAVRLEASPVGTTAHMAGPLTDVEERRLARHATPSLVEALFARTTILVEGAGDRLALRTASHVAGVDLDARGVSIVELDGADLFPAMHRLLGPDGLGVDVVGICDADRERKWADAVLGAGAYDGDRSVLAQHGVHVMDPDLESALVAALGEARVEAVVAADGEADALAIFRQQPDQAPKPAIEQLVRFIKKGKTRWPPLLTAALAASELPQPLAAVLADV